MSSIRQRLAKVEARVEPPTPVERPTYNELWCHYLIFNVSTAVELYASARSDGRGLKHACESADDPYHLYAHHDKLRSRADVLEAPEDVLLEAMGCPPFEQWGWLHWMVRQIDWFSLIASNWGLEAIQSCFGQRFSDAAAPTDEERIAQAALYFLGMMRERGRERGRDPVAEVRKLGESVKADYKETHGSVMSEEQFVERLRVHDEFAYYVYTCESGLIRLEASARTPRHRSCLYPADYVAEHLSRMRAVYARFLRASN